MLSETVIVIIHELRHLDLTVSRGVPHDEVEFDPQESFEASHSLTALLPVPNHAGTGGVSTKTPQQSPELEHNRRLESEKI